MQVLLTFSDEIEEMWTHQGWAYGVRFWAAKILAAKTLILILTCVGVESQFVLRLIEPCFAVLASIAR